VNPVTEKVYVSPIDPVTSLTVIDEDVKDHHRKE
jgi:hypothetical protein